MSASTTVTANVNRVANTAPFAADEWVTWVGPTTTNGHSNGHRSPQLRGRRDECEALDRLLASTRSGQSQALILRGEAGIGKTALLEFVAERASGCRVRRVAGVESEMELAFAGLQQLCTPILNHVERLPRPQRDALGTAIGLCTGGTPDRLLVGLAVLNLLAEVAEAQPLICLIDDAQWLDRASAQTLAFVARRLQAEPVALVFAVRSTRNHEDLLGLPELVVRGLSDVDARALLGAALLGPLDAAVRDAIVAEARGNPLALLELPRGLAPAELAGGFGLLDAVPLRGHLEESFRRRLAALPNDTQRLLLVAAADPLGEPRLLWRAARQLGISVEAADRAAEADLIEIGARVRFRHPLVRSTVYHAARRDDRRSAHRALAEATDPATDPDRRAWHRSRAVPAPDESVAEELERSADRAQARGGVAAAAAFLKRSVELTPDPVRRGARALAAAQATIVAGSPDMAYELLATAELCPLDDFQRAKLQRLHAERTFTLTRGSEVPKLLLEAAKRLEPLDAGLARETYLEALSAAQFAGRLARGVGVREAAEAARAAPSPCQPPRAPDLLLDGLTTRFTEGYAAGAPMLKRALGAFRSPDVSHEEGLRWLWLACTSALDLWDDETWELLASRHVRLARESGALAVLPLALSSRMALHIFAGELTAAASLIEELTAVVHSNGSRLAPYGALLLASAHGREAEAAELFESIENEVAPRGEGIGLMVLEWASALLASGAGRYDDALAAAQRASEHPEEVGVSTWALPEVIETAVRLGQSGRAASALQRLAAVARSSGTNWALGIEARSRALLSQGAEGEHLYREAIERLGHTRVRLELARAHLVYGEWLRRANRRIDARTQLRTAYEMFTAMGAEGFAERTHRELLATGETVRKRTVDLRYDLTPQELQIARLARDGLSNPEIGERIFLSPRTVEWHLGNVFRKLGISSRKQLRRALTNGSSATVPAELRDTGVSSWNTTSRR
jgi:DNA-binding CsgD family transcriptional regulator